MNTENPAAPGGIRVIIAEDQTMVLGALAALLEMESDIDVIAQVRNGREALQAVLVHKPDVLVTDIEMPEMTGLELAVHLKGRSTAKVIVVTTFARPGYLRRALDAGAQGYLLKDSPARELANAVRRVHQGHRVIDSELAAEALAEEDPLTDRERQVLRLAGDGASSEEIAKRLGLSDGTVRNYLSEAIGKLHAANRTDAARIARAKGWL
jgi:two-component system response regulator DesR